MSEDFLSRRMILKKLVGAASVIGVATSGLSMAEVCGKTPRQQEGPYYPESDLNRDYDLTRLTTDSERALGQVIYVQGIVQSVGCVPLERAIVEVWQACESGRYNHSEDTNPLPLDKNFQYWGRATTDKKGRYEIITIVPGHYPTSPTTYRPPHIHFKVHAAGFRSLTTQMYFDPKSYDDPELAKIVKKWNDYEKVDPRLIVKFEPTLLEQGAKAGNFVVTLENMEF